MQRYLANQVFQWLYKKSARSFFDMTDISKSNRTFLDDRFRISLPSVGNVLKSQDGTIKYLFVLHDGATIESVYIPEAKRSTLCVSTQVGCKFGCKFCRTARLGFIRNLTVAEIVGQVVLANDLAGEPAAQTNDDSDSTPETSRRISNIVFMGMGEPLDNVENLLPALNILLDDYGFAQSPRKTTVSTSGHLANLLKLSAFPNIGIAVSINAPNDPLRSEIMPINRKYPLKDLIDHLKSYPLIKRRRFTIEYILFGGLNDEPRHALELHLLLSGVKVKINLIPYNDNGISGFISPAADTLDRFAEILVEHGHQVNIRKSRGQDIAAACGMLATQAMNQQGERIY